MGIFICSLFYKEYISAYVVLASEPGSRLNIKNHMIEIAKVLHRLAFSINFDGLLALIQDQAGDDVGVF